jgi:hypothetical protein
MDDADRSVVGRQQGLQLANDSLRQRQRRDAVAGDYCAHDAGFNSALIWPVTRRESDWDVVIAGGARGAFRRADLVGAAGF